MQEYNGGSAVPENPTLLRAVYAGPSASDVETIPQATFPAGTATTGRLTLPQVLPTIVFPMIGCFLYVAGMPMGETFEFLAGCGGIGAAVTVSVTGGRRVAIGLAHAVLSAAGTR